MIAEMTRRLRAQIPFCFVKFGDGELLCMRGDPGENGDGQKYTTELRDALRAALLGLASDPECFFARWIGPEQEILKDFLSQNGKWPPKWNWCDFHEILLHRERDRESLAKFYVALRDDRRAKLLVAPERLSGAAYFLEPDAWLGVPLHAAFEFLGTKNGQFGWEQVLITCCGPAAKPLIYQRWRDQKVTCIDVGSGLDPYCGFNTRPGQVAPAEAQRILSEI